MRSVKDAIASTQAAAARAAASATAGVARSLVAPRTSYEFEATWKSLAGDRSSQGRLLKVIATPHHNEGKSKPLRGVITELNGKMCADAEACVPAFAIQGLTGSPADD